MQKKDIKKQQGFTLIEILVVIGMIALLAAIVIVAINPARQFAQGRNTQRTSNVNTILNAIGQNMADNKGIFTCGSEEIDATKKYVCAGTCKDNEGTTLTDTVDLSCLTPSYVSVLPFDPDGSNYAWTSKTAYNTGYTVELDDSRVKVCAPESTDEASALGLTSFDEICVTR